MSCWEWNKWTWDGNIMLGIWELYWFLQHVSLYPITYKYHNNICIYIFLCPIHNRRQDYRSLQHLYSNTHTQYASLTPFPAPHTFASPSHSAPNTPSCPDNPNLDAHNFPYPKPFSLSNNLSEIIIISTAPQSRTQTRSGGPLLWRASRSGRFAWPEKDCWYGCWL